MSLTPHQRNTLIAPLLVLPVVLPVVGAVLAAILTGCAAPTTPTASPTPAAPSALATPTSPLATPSLTPTTELQPVVVTIGLWLPEELNPYGDGRGAAVLSQQLDNFSEAYPDVQVEVTVKKAHGRGGLLDFLRTARAAAPTVLPDLVVLDAADLETAARSGLIQPLTPFLSGTAAGDRFPFAVSLGAVDGETWGFVVGADMQHLAYRPDLLDSPPLSWTQVISPPVPFVFPAGGHDRQVNDATLIQYLAAGGRLSDDEGRPTLDEEVLAEVLQFYADGASREVISPTFETPAISPTLVLNIHDAAQSWETFRAGQGLIAVVPAGRYWPESDETFAPAPIPTRDGHPFSIARGWVLALVTDDPDRQALAGLLLDWLIAPDHNGEWTQAAGYLPGTLGGLRAWDISNAERAVLRGVMEAAVPPPRPEVMNTAGRVMQEAVEAVLRGRATPSEAARAAAESMGQ